MFLSLIAFFVISTPSYATSDLKSCPKTIVKTFDGSWTKDDEVILDAASKRCGQLYPNSPCVKLIQKLAPQEYRVTCGPENKIT